MRPLVKVCGLTRREDVDGCLELGVNWLGFIFHPKSPRLVDSSFPAGLGRLPARKVGVFVDQSLEETQAIMARGGLDMAQLHGGNVRHDEAFCRALGDRKAIKVFWPERYWSLAALEAELERYSPFCGHFLFDAGKGGGGHGRCLDFQALARLKSPRPWFLAGGLAPDTLPEALALSPFGLDLNSGVEEAPGRKSRAKLKQALDLIRQGDV